MTSHGLVLNKTFFRKFLVFKQLFDFSGAVKTCSLAVSSLENSLKYWKDFLQMTPVPGSDNNKEALLTYSQDSQCYLRLAQLEEGESVEHATAYGRIAFSVPEDQVDSYLFFFTSF